MNKIYTMTIFDETILIKDNSGNQSFFSKSNGKDLSIEQIIKQFEDDIEVGKSLKISNMFELPENLGEEMKIDEKEAKWSWEHWYQYDNLAQEFGG